MTTNLWPLLLYYAWRIDGLDPDGLYGALQGLHSLGAAVVKTDDGLRLTGGAMDAAEYAAARERYLLPHKDALIALLGKAAAWREIPDPGWIGKTLPGVTRCWYKHRDGQVIDLVETDTVKDGEVKDNG